MRMVRSKTARVPRPRGHRLAGFTLLEVLIAAAIVGVAFVSVTNAMSAATSSKEELASEPFQASQLAQEVHTLSKILSREPSGTTGATSAAAVTALDSLIGASFSPPILADGTQANSLTGWRQSVSLDVYAIDNLSTPTGEDPAALFATYASRMFQLTVTILENGTQVGTYQWWITP
jgi:prepilin-type N-terminal cleavage/methylation domain-containing protein